MNIVRKINKFFDKNKELHNVEIDMHNILVEREIEYCVMNDRDEVLKILNNQDKIIKQLPHCFVDLDKMTIIFITYRQ